MTSMTRVAELAEAANLAYDCFMVDEFGEALHELETIAHADTTAPAVWSLCAEVIDACNNLAYARQMRLEGNVDLALDIEAKAGGELNEVARAHGC